MEFEILRVKRTFDWPVGKYWDGSQQASPPTGSCFQIWRMGDRKMPISPVLVSHFHLARWLENSPLIIE